MIRINKRNEPKEWTEYRLTPGVSYTSTPGLREALLREQGYICAYCMRRIAAEKSRIEHIKCRERYSELELDYNNMVICCSGETDSIYHCDREKGNADISFTPLDEHFIDTVSYETKSGKIKSSNPVCDNEINSILNLNNKLFELNRKQVIEGVIEALKQRKWTNISLISKLTEWQSINQKHELKEYCGVVIWYLKKKIAKSKLPRSA
jgi:uncharacterized protein (TIGR02646 family)